MKRLKLASLLTAALCLLCGCSSTAAPETSLSETLPPMTEAPDPALIYYATDHGTTDPGELTQFMGKLADTGYTVESDVLAQLPMNADAVVINSPQEDLTQEDVEALDLYMDQGGHVLLLAPAFEGAVRFKYLGRFLEEYCIVMDDDRIRETDKSRMLGEQEDHILVDQIHAPTGMTIVPETAERPLYQHGARSFRFAVMDNFDNVQQDLMLRTAASAVGEPCGGTSDDPVTYEGETLTTMLYSRDETRQNSFVVCVGAADFLLDENFTREESLSAQDYVFAALAWAGNPIIF
ncbi:MAG: Gldg family protein [Oscillospiraceae bacterium]|nr:Gldg family protein [Oscillospiraceae bacterium]